MRLLSFVYELYMKRNRIMREERGIAFGLGLGFGLGEMRLGSARLLLGSVVY